MIHIFSVKIEPDKLVSLEPLLEEDAFWQFLPHLAASPDPCHSNSALCEEKGWKCEVEFPLIWFLLFLTNENPFFGFDTGLRSEILLPPLTTCDPSTPVTCKLALIVCPHLFHSIVSQKNYFCTSQLSFHKNEIDGVWWVDGVWWRGCLPCNSCQPALEWIAPLCNFA